MQDIALLLAQFKARMEWFEQAEVYRQTRASRKGEAFLDRRLRLWLFDHGFAWPYSAPPTPERADALAAHLGGKVACVVETACFFTGAGTQYRERGLREAASRARRAASEQGFSAAYVVVFNLSPLELRFDFHTPGEVFSELFAPEARLRLLTVNVNPNLPTARNKARARPHDPVLTAEMLLSDNA